MTADAFVNKSTVTVTKRTGIIPKVKIRVRVRARGDSMSQKVPLLVSEVAHNKTQVKMSL